MKEENEENSMESEEMSDSEMSVENEEEVEEKKPEDEGEGRSPNKKVLNTQELMNLMTIMVREVRQKKVWLVRRLIKKIKMLKKKKGTEIQKRKNEAHIVALQQEVFYSRIFDISKAAKFLLLNTQKDLQKILSYSYNETKPAIRFQAKMGLIFDSIKKKVDSFHNAYPNWREFLPVWFYKNRQNKKDTLIKTGIFVNQSQAKNAQTRNRSSLTPEGQKINESNSIVDSFNSWNVSGEMKGEVKEEKSDVKLEKVKKEDQKKNSKNIKKTSNLSTEVSVKESKPLDEKKPENSVRIFYKKRKISDSEESIPTLIPIDSKPTKIAKKEPKSDSISKASEVASPPPLKSNPPKDATKDIEVASPPPLKSDPFFLTADNREYLSSSKSKVAEYNPMTPEDKLAQKKFVKKPAVSRHNNFDPEKFNLKFEKKNKNFESEENAKFSKRGFSDKNSKFKKNFESEKNTKFSKRGFSEKNSKFNKNSGNSKKFNNEKPILHPSWQAKKKLSGITEFKGTKIQFD